MSLEFLLTSLVVVVIPGTGVLYTVSSAIGGGWRIGLFAAVVGAIQKGPEAKEQMKRIQAHAAFGCGRQAVRVLDEQHQQHQSTRKATKANTEI